MLCARLGSVFIWFVIICHLCYHRIIFVNTIAMTTMNFVLERKEGLFERFYSAGTVGCHSSQLNNMWSHIGASVADFLLAYILHASVILSVQVILLMVATYAILGVSNIPIVAHLM